MGLTGRTAGKVLQAVVLVAWVALPIVALPDDGLVPSKSPDWGDRPPVVKFNCGHIPTKGWEDSFGKYASDETRLAEATRGGDGAKIANGAMATMHAFRQTVYFPPLTVGDIVPAFGALYRVSDIVDLGSPDELKGKDLSDPKNVPPGTLLHRGWMTMALAEKPGLPQGLTFEEGSIAVPLIEEGTELNPKDGKGIAGASFHFDRSSAGMRVKIAQGAVGNAREPAAEVDVRAQDFAGAHPKGVNLPVRISNATVRRGDVLPIEGLRYKIRNVVPRDPKQHIIGWIELEPAAPNAPADHGAPHQPNRS